MVIDDSEEAVRKIVTALDEISKTKKLTEKLQNEGTFTTPKCEDIEARDQELQKFLNSLLARRRGLQKSLNSLVANGTLTVENQIADSEDLPDSEEVQKLLKDAFNFRDKANEFVVEVTTLSKDMRLKLYSDTQTILSEIPALARAPSLALSMVIDEAKNDIHQARNGEYREAVVECFKSLFYQASNDEFREALIEFKHSSRQISAQRLIVDTHDLLVEENNFSKKAKTLSVDYAD